MVQGEEGEPALRLEFVWCAPGVSEAVLDRLFRIRDEVAVGYTDALAYGVSDSLWSEERGHIPLEVQ